jgi:release factor glutamine methyltransferase
VLPMLLREALRAGLERLIEEEIPSPELSAELLLMQVLRCDRSYLYSRPEQPVPPEGAYRYFQLIAERSTGKPTQYITGHQEFWGLGFEVTPDVLIPRPETEHLVESGLELVRDCEPCRIVDVGTGSGCIALALASELRHAEVHAIDISPAALVVARRNAAQLGFAEQVRFWEGDLLSPLLDEGYAGSFDLVVSNPPYVGDHEMSLVQREVREFEPRLAWHDPDGGNGIYRRLVPQALQLLRASGHCVVEIGFLKAEAVTGLFGEGWSGVKVRPDLAGIPRVVIATKTAM